MGSTAPSAEAWKLMRQGVIHRYTLSERLPSGAPPEIVTVNFTETAREYSDLSQATMAFICKRLKLNYEKLFNEERKRRKRIAQKPDLLKNPKPQRGKK